MPNIIPFPSIEGGTDRYLSKAAETARPDELFMAEKLLDMRDLLANITVDLEVRLAELTRTLEDKALE